MEQAAESLRIWIHDHRVTWETGPLQEMVAHERASVGFEVRLFARHAPDDHAWPGCGLCVALYRRLREVAQAVLPEAERSTGYDLEPFDASFHLRPEAEWSDEVQLTIRVVHREGYLRPVDECEKRCTEEIGTNLERLGVQRRTWSEARARRALEAAASEGVSLHAKTVLKGETS